MAASKKQINNIFYDTLNEKWLETDDHPIALLQAENRLRNPWICQLLKQKERVQSVLDVGCGAGLLTNTLAKEGFQVSGIDLSLPSLEIARKTDTTKSVNYLLSSVYSLPFENRQFDAVLALDVLEHIEHPQKAILEIARVLKPGGTFIFYTFNRNYLSYLFVIKAVEWLVPNTPKNMHIYPLFITPKEMQNMCYSYNLTIEEWLGMRPAFSKAFWRSLLQRKVVKDFSFQFSSSLKLGYMGIACKGT